MQGLNRRNLSEVEHVTVRIEEPLAERSEPLPRRTNAALLAGRLLVVLTAMPGFVVRAARG